MLAREICSGVSQKSVVLSFMNNMVEGVWMEAQAREAWRLMMDSQQVQMKVLGMIEDQGKKIAEVAKEGKRKERLDRNEKLRKYWKVKREEAQLEAVRGQISILNLSNEWLDVEMHYHEEMDKLINVAGAVVGLGRVGGAVAEWFVRVTLVVGVPLA